MSETPVSTSFTFVLRDRLCALLVGGLFFLASTYAQAATVRLGDGTAVPGQSQVALPLSVTLASGEHISALSVEVFYDPSLIQWQSVAVEPTAAALGKQAQANLLKPGHICVVLYGMDRQTLSSGPLAQLLLTVLASAPAGSTIFDLRNGQAADPNGTEMAVSVSSGRLWVELPAPPPTVEITRPQSGNVGSPGTVPISFRVANTTLSADGIHLALTLDGAAPISLDTTDQYNWANVQPGSHTILLQLVDALDRPLTNPEASASVTTRVVEEVVPDPSVTIRSPKKRKTVTGSTVSLRYAVRGVTLRSGSAYHHLHVRIDKGEIWHVYNTDPMALRNLKPGRHVIDMWLVDNVNHRSLHKAHSYDYTVFTVK